MKGFDAEFTSLDQYIRVITARIWEGRRLDDIHLYYSDPCVVETPLSVSTSVQSVVDGTRATLAMFPDRRLLAEDVIQSGNADTGFLSSHRIISPMTHQGDGRFGPTSGRRVQARTIADCVCLNNRIVHEWLVRDHAAIALQIGSSPQALAQRWLDAEGGRWKKPQAGPAPAGYVSHISHEPLAQAYAQMLEGFTHARFELAALYDDAAQHLGPGEVLRYGHADISGFWHSLFGGMDVHRFELEHLAFQSDYASTGRPDRVALRFRALADYVPNKMTDCPRQYSIVRYGNNSVTGIELMGIVHAEFCRGKLVREWVLLDDVAIWMQVLSQRA
jgi:predicted ester cyclase